MQDLLEWLKSYSLHPAREMCDNARLLYDVQVMEGIVKIFNDFTSSEDIHVLCRAFYDAYLSGDNKSKLLVSLLLPTMLNAYLVRLHADDSMGSTINKHLSNQSDRNSHPSFGLDDLPVFINPLESVAFLLSEFCQYAPAFIRCPERYGSDMASLPDYRVASVYHSPTFKSTTKSQQSETVSVTVTKTCNVSIMPKFNHANAITTIPPSTLPDLNPSCIVRIYVDILERQFQEGTVEQQGIVVVSIRTFCDFVDRLTSLNMRRILPYSHHHHLGLLVDLSIAIDKLLFMLSFDISQPADSSVIPLVNGKKTLRGRLFEDLLPKMERYASYHCFASVLLIVGAMRNAWRLGLYPIPSASATVTTPIDRRARHTSEKEADLSDSTLDESIDCMRSFRPTSAHRLSVFTNANFRAEPVSEDIPISGGQEVTDVATEDRQANLYLHRKRNHHRPHHQKQQNIGDILMKSSNNLHLALSSSTISLNKESQHHWRFWSKHRQEKD